MLLTRLVQTVSGSPCRSYYRSTLKNISKPVISSGLALMAALSSGYVASAQTLVLTKTPAVTDIYSSGVQAFPSTAVGTNSAAITLSLTVTGGAMTITSITVPTSTARIQQFTVGAITGCTVNGTTSNPTGTVCKVPVTFNPAYTGYQTSPLIAVTSNGNFQFGLNGSGTGPQAILLPGILSTIAGNGTKQASDTAYTGDGGQATAAQVESHGFTFDALGNIFEAEYDASVVRKITPAGIITTVAGAETTTGGVETSTRCATPTTVPGCGDGAAATTANFGTTLPDVTLDSAGNLYISDGIDNRVRRVDAATNIISTIAGTGSATTTGSGNSGDNGAATAAQMNTPEAVMVDNADNLYVLNSNASQTNGSVVRYITSAGTITTLAGTGTPCTALTTTANACGDNGQSTAATLNTAAAFYVDPTTGNIWIADKLANRIRFIDRSTGIITTVAGTGATGYTGDGGPATAATFNGPHGILVDPAGNLYIADRGNNVVRFVQKSTGIITTIAGGGATCAAGGSGTCGDGGLSNGPLANLQPNDIRLDVTGNVYIADGLNYSIRKIATSPITLAFPSTAVGTTAGPLTATLQNIGTSTLTYTTPSSGTNAAVTTTGPTALPSKAFAQTNATTCGPISSTSTTGNTLASGSSCNFVVNFTPDTATGNYTGTLIETDNSLNSGTGNPYYPTAQTQTVNLTGAATAQTATVALASNPNPSTYGASVAFVTTLSGTGVAPTGTVTYTYTPTGSTTAQTIGTAPVVTANGVSTATLNYALLPVGTDNIVATYGGDTNYVAGTQSAADAQVVNKADGTKDTLTAAPTASTYGSNVVLTFTVPTTAGLTAPSGTVTFTSGGVTLGTGTISTANGVSTATLTTSKLPVGTDTVTATYPGDANYGSAAPTATEAVSQASGASDTLTANPTNSTFGSPVALTFTVPTVAGAAASPTGTVTFTSGGVTLGTGTLSTTGTGATAVTTATLTTSALPIGTDTVTANYPGDTNYAAASPAPTATETVSAAGTDSLAASPASTTYGSPVTLTFTVPVTAGSTTTPTGTVTFTSGGKTLGTGTIAKDANGNYTATLITTALPVGTDTVTSTYPGDGNYPAAAPTATETVSKTSGSSDTLAANPTSATVGSPVVLTFTVPTVAGATASPTGTVTFTSGGVTLGTGTLSTTGTGANAVTTATLSTSALPVGTDTVTATYPGDTNYGASNPNPTATVTINKVPGSTDTLTLNPTSTTYGMSVLVTFNIPAVTGFTTAPTGTVTFTNGNQTLGTGTLAAAAGGGYSATITTTTLPVGSDLITGTYAGDTNYGSAAPTATETVTRSNGSFPNGPTLTANPTSSTYGSPVVLTYSEGTVAGAAANATGTVVFTSGGVTLGTGTLSTTGTGANAVTTASITTSALPVGTDTITGSYGGDTNYLAAAPITTETVGAVGADSVTATPSPATYGATVTLTFTVPTAAGATTNPTGPVTFTSGGVTLGTANISTANGVSTATITTTVLPVGSDVITATYGGSTNYPAAAPTTTETINKGNPFPPTPGAGLTTNPNPSNFGQTVTITQTLTTTGAAAPTGSVSFIYNGTTLGTATISGGTASITTATLPVGTDPITSTYTGDANYASGNGGPVNQVVNQAGTSATLAAGPNPATFGTPVTLTEMINPINGSCPAGPVTFLNNGTVLGTGTISLTNGSCVATIMSSTLPVGTDQITATVPASGGFTAITSGPVALVINKANGADTLTSNPNPSVFGTSVTITDTIPTVAGVAPTGTVNFFSFGTQIGTGTVNAQGVATFATTALPVGTDSLTATYLGDGNYAQVGAGPVNQVVTAVSPNAQLAVGPNPTTFGTTVTFTETIPTTNGTPATGQVLFYQNGTLVGVGTLANGIASITTSTLPVGTDPITATYAGNTNYAAVNSGPVNEVVNKANGPDTLNVSPDPAVFGATVTMTDTIPTVGGVAPTGTVTFYNNGTAIGTSPVSTTGVATLTSTTLPVGSNPITAIYNGDTNYASETAGPVNEVITVGNTTPVLAANPNPSTFGTPVTLTESIPGINGVSPTGSVTFTYNGTALGTATVTNGVATLVTSTLPVGTDPVTATYTGDGNYAAANSGPLNVVVNKAAPRDTLIANPSPSTFGSPVTLTFSIPPVNGVPPTGTVSFYNGTTLLGTGTVNAQGIATITTSALPYGTDTVTGQYLGDNNYAPSSEPATVTVNPVSPKSVVTVPTGSPICGTSVTLTDTITPVNGVALGGTVQFYDNGTAIGSPVSVPASGVVTLTTTSLACTTDLITAIYTPPANSPYLPSTGGPATIVVQNPDFSIAATPPNQTVNPGDTTTYTVSLSGVGLPFTSPVTLTATGLPPGATVSFANGTYVPGQGPTSTTMTIVTAPNQAVLHHSSTNGIYYGLLLLPLLGLGKVRRKIKALPKGITYCLAALVMLGGLGAMTGCGGGYFGPAPQTFTITVTGTSGVLVHSTTVTLTVR